MIATTWNSLPLFLLDDPPDWSGPVRGGFELAWANEVGLSNRETRRAMGATPRVVLQFQTVAAGPAATRLAACLRAWQTEQVAVPFWPAAVRWADRGASAISAKLKVAFTPDFGTWELFEATEPGWPAADDMVAPLLLGRIARNDPVWLTPTTCRFDVDFEEASASDYALTVTSQEWTSGPEPSGAWANNGPALLPFRLHHDQPRLGTDVEIERERIGFGRQTADTLYAQPNHRRGEAPFVEAGAAAIASLLRFFVDHGDGRAFWAPSWSAAAIPTEALEVGETELAVEAGHAVSAGDWLAFLSNGDEGFAKVTTAGPTSLTLATAPGAFPFRTLVVHLLLCRFERPRIQVDWLSPTVARVRMAIRELPAEYAPTADETLGTTVGRLPVRAWLYELREATSDAGVTIHRYTSFERDLDIDGDLYASVPIDHGAIRQGIALDRDEVEVRLATEAGNTSHPLVRLATLRCEVPLFLTIRRLNLMLPPS